MEGILILLLSYFIGSIPTGYIVTYLLTGRDIRNYGSGNVGGLNTYRTVKEVRGRMVGGLAGSIVALFDASKAVISYLLSLAYAPSVAVFAPMVAIFGHNYPVWLKFKGGRGLAALLGFFLYTMPLLFLFFLLIQGTVYLFTRRFALGAILALLTAIPLHYLTLSAPSYTSQVLSELPVWLRYREKYELWIRGRLGVNM